MGRDVQEAGVGQGVEIVLEWMDCGQLEEADRFKCCVYDSVLTALDVMLI